MITSNGILIKIQYFLFWKCLLQTKLFCFDLNYHLKKYEMKMLLGITADYQEVSRSFQKIFVIISFNICIINVSFIFSLKNFRRFGQSYAHVDHVLDDCPRIFHGVFACFDFTYVKNYIFNVLICYQSQRYLYIDENFTLQHRLWLSAKSNKGKRVV